MPEWDSEAVEYAQKKATWAAWCDRQGWTWRDSYDRRGWEKNQFRAALRKMPRDHPDRWKYEIGKRYSPRGGEAVTTLAIIFSVALPIMSVPVSVTSGFPFWAVAFPAVIVSWFIYARRRHRALST